MSPVEVSDLLAQIAPIRARNVFDEGIFVVDRKGRWYDLCAAEVLRPLACIFE